MQTLTNQFANLSLTDPVLWYAIGSGLVVTFLFLYFGRRASRGPLLEGASDAALLKAALEWSPPEMRPDERRRQTRRGGMPTPIHIIDLKAGRRAREGYVLDRSSGGLRLAVQRHYPTGTTLQIRPQNAPKEVEWINVIVRNCREIGDYFEIGCQFEHELPWNVLLMFG